MYPLNASLDILYLSMRNSHTALVFTRVVTNFYEYILHQFISCTKMFFFIRFGSCCYIICNLSYFGNIPLLITHFVAFIISFIFSLCNYAWKSYQQDNRELTVFKHLSILPFCITFSKFKLVNWLYLQM